MQPKLVAQNARATSGHLEWGANRFNISLAATSVPIVGGPPAQRRDLLGRHLELKPSTGKKSTVFRIDRSMDARGNAQNARNPGPSVNGLLRNSSAVVSKAGELVQQRQQLLPTHGWQTEGTRWAPPSA